MKEIFMTEFSFISAEKDAAFVTSQVMQSKDIQLTLISKHPKARILPNLAFSHDPTLIMYVMHNSEIFAF